MRSSISSTARARRMLPGALQLIAGLRHRGGSGGLPGARQHPTPAVHHRDVLRAQARHGGGDQVQHGLRALPVQPGRAGHRQHDARLRVLAVPCERLAPGQHQVDAGRPHALQGAYGARQLPLHGAGLVDALLEAGGGQGVAAVEDLVADAAARRQAVLGQQQPRAGDLVGGHQDAGAPGLDHAGDAGAVQRIRDLPGLPQFHVGIQQRHRRVAAAHPQPAQQAQQRHGHGRHRTQPRRSQPAQALEHRAHAKASSGCSVRHAARVRRAGLPLD